MAAPLESTAKKTFVGELRKLTGKEVQLRLNEVMMQGIMIEVGEDYVRLGGNGGHPSLVPLAMCLYAQPIYPIAGSNDK